MARCPSCKKRFAVLEDEDDGQHGCPYCGYGDPDVIFECKYCGKRLGERGEPCEECAEFQ